MGSLHLSYPLLDSFKMEIDPVMSDEEPMELDIIGTPTHMAWSPSTGSFLSPYLIVRIIDGIGRLRLTSKYGMRSPTYIETPMIRHGLTSIRDRVKPKRL
ncbi:unnamed protein product [Nezara viridula]|nr:unnamed protein product [Nezara viridula]